jgi:hypothetical protein
VTNTLAGPALITVFVNGIPSTAKTLNLNYATNVSLNAPSINYDANGIITVTVSSNGAIPADAVTLRVDGGAPMSQSLAPVYGSSPQQATATFILTKPSAGAHALSASYAAQANFAASSSSGTLNVSQAATTTTVVSSKNPSTFGQMVTFTATVASDSGTPTGIVVFKDGATTLGTSALSGGSATFSTTALAGGGHNITAEYGGDTNFTTSTGTLVGGQVVNTSGTLVLLQAAPNPSRIGQTVTLTATLWVSGTDQLNMLATCALTGSVTFKDGAKTLGSAGVDGNCQATFSTAVLAVGSHNITAEYGGDDHYGSSVSSALVQRVDQYLFLPMIVR